MNILPHIQDFLTNQYMFFIWFSATFLGFYILRSIIIGRLVYLSKKTTNTIDDVVVAVLRTINAPFAIAVSILAGLWAINVSINGSVTFLIICVLIITYQASRALMVLIDYAVAQLAGDENVTAFQGLKTIIKIIIWTGGLVFLAGALGYNITSMVAGLGIGGIAIALAAQNILSDMFSSFSIYFDKPFNAGDYIVIGTQEGTVERIGLKTTRLRSPRGEEIVVSNQELTSAVVQNLGTIEKRRAVDILGFAYDTPNAKLDKLQNKIKRIVNSAAPAEFARLHFKNFGSSALEWELVYYINTGDYTEFMNTRHAINMTLKQYFEKEEMELAYPTQTIHVKK